MRWDGWLVGCLAISSPTAICSFASIDEDRAAFPETESWRRVSVSQSVIPSSFLAGCEVLPGGGSRATPPPPTSHPASPRPASRPCHVMVIAVSRFVSWPNVPSDNRLRECRCARVALAPGPVPKPSIHTDRLSLFGSALITEHLCNPPGEMEIRRLSRSADP
jgi:hypothetical protein